MPGELAVVRSAVGFADYSRYELGRQEDELLAGFLGAVEEGERDHVWVDGKWRSGWRGCKRGAPLGLA